MNSFNLTFSGAIMAGRDPQRARARFAEVFGIEDPEELEQYFSGETFVMRRDLDRREGGEYYVLLRKYGLEVSLVKIEIRGKSTPPAAEPTPAARENSRAERRSEARQRKRQRKQAGAARKQERIEAKRSQQEVKTRAREETREEQQRTAEARQKAKDEAREQRARDKEAREHEAREQEAREREARAQEAREREARDREARERKERVLKARKIAQEKVAREQAARDREAEELAAAEAAAAREQTAAREQAARELEAREQAAREQAAREPETQKQASITPPSPAAASTSSGKKKETALSGRKRIRSRLGLARRSEAPHRDSRARRGDVPNPYRLEPFRHSPEVRLRANLARRAVRRGLLAAGCAFAFLLILLGGFIGQRPAAAPTGPAAVTATTNGKLYLLLGQQLLQHDRAGVPQTTIELAEMGIRDVTGPLLPGADNSILMRARPLEGDDTAPRGLWSCHPKLKECHALPGEYASIEFDSAVFHPISGDLILANTGEGLLLRVDSSGNLVARAERKLPQAATLRLDTGLLLINSPTAPAISVLRIEPEAFGKQIDELLLLPPAGIEAGRTRVVDFLWQGELWWVSMQNPESGSSGTYLFDPQWNYLREIDRLASSPGARMTQWNQKVLLGSPRSEVIQRYNAEGLIEADFKSPLLVERLGEEAQSRYLHAIAWELALLVCGSAIILGLIYSGIHQLRLRVYSGRQARGAEPLDTLLDQVTWLPTAPHRQQQLRRSSTAYLTLAVGIVVIAIALGVSMLQLLALLLALGGPLIVLQTLLRSPADHVGLLGDRLVLVDHRERYHCDQPDRTAFRGPFLFIDDIVVFTGTALLPAIDPASKYPLLASQLRNAVPASWSEILTRLRESNHPLARGSMAALAALALALFIIAIGNVAR